MVKARRLISFQFIVRHHFGLRGACAFWHTTVHTIDSSEPFFVFPSSLLTGKSVNLVVTCDGFLKFSTFFILATLITYSCFLNTY